MEMMVGLEIAKYLSTFYMEADGYMKQPDYDLMEVRGLKC